MTKCKITIYSRTLSLPRVYILSASTVVTAGPIESITKTTELPTETSTHETDGISIYVNTNNMK